MLWLALRGEKTDVFFYGMGLGEVGGSIVEEERVLQALATDGGGGAVAGVDLGGVGESEDFILDALQKGAGAATREIGASNAVAEKDVAPEEVTGGGGVKAEAVGRMARDVENGPGGAEQFEGGGFGDQVGHGEGGD